MARGCPSLLIMQSKPGASKKTQLTTVSFFFLLFILRQNLVKLLGKSTKNYESKTLTGPIVLHDKLRSTKVLLVCNTC